MFKDAITAITAAPKPAPKDVGKDAALPRPRPPEATAKVEARPTPEVIADIQRELIRRGYYEGVVDGRYGPRTDAAVRDFEQASGVKASTEPNEALLAAIKRSTAKPAKAPSGLRPAVQQARLEPGAETSSKRVLAVQRAL